METGEGSTAAFGIVTKQHQSDIWWLCVKHAVELAKLDMRSGWKSIMAITHIKSDTLASGMANTGQAGGLYYFVSVDGDPKALVAKLSLDILHHHIADDEVICDLVRMGKTFVTDSEFSDIVREAVADVEGQAA